MQAAMRALSLRALLLLDVYHGGRGSGRVLALARGEHLRVACLPVRLRHPVQPTEAVSACD
jgi:hypothetical protein